MKRADLSRAVDVVVAERLAPDGFRRRRGMLRLDLGSDEGASGWLGLNRAVRRGDGVVHVNPVVGVHHAGVERLVGELHPDEKASRWITPTISTPIGYLGPERSSVQWDFRAEDELDPVGTSLADAVRTYGIPFMRRHRALPEIVEALRAGLSPVPEQRAERLVAALQLGGDPEAAGAALGALVALLDDRDDPAAVRSRAFVDHFRARFPA